MLSFKGYEQSQYDELNEKLITFANQAYPKFGNVVIMAGGAGSGKGFVIKNLVGLEGFKFDVDELKKLAAKVPAIVKKVKDEIGINLKNLNLLNPDDTSTMHEIISDYLEIPDNKTKALYTSILTAAPDRKPNIIFDTTLQSLRKLERLTNQVKNLGYAEDKIHLVWVINDIEVAKVQNKSPGRGRVVKNKILVNTHRGAAQTMLDIVNLGKELKDFMDGDIVFAFNKAKVDSEYVKSKSGGGYVKAAEYFYVKRAGKDVVSLDVLSRDIKEKIKSYVPKNIEWA